MDFREFFSPQTKSYGLAQIPPWFYPRIRAGPCTFVFGVFFWSLADRNAPFPRLKGGKRMSIFYWPFRGLICDRNAPFQPLKGGKRLSILYWPFRGRISTPKRVETLIYFSLGFFWFLSGSKWTSPGSNLIHLGPEMCNVHPVAQEVCATT